jgi:hypothetical protein
MSGHEVLRHACAFQGQDADPDPVRLAGIEDKLRASASAPMIT